MKTSQSSSIEHKRRNLASGRIDKAQIVPLKNQIETVKDTKLNNDKGRAMSSEIKLDTRDTSWDVVSRTDEHNDKVLSDAVLSKSSGILEHPSYLQSLNDPAGLFLKSVTLVPQKSLPSTIPAVDTHISDEVVWNLNQLHKSNNCSNCGKFVCGKCKVHKYSMPYQVIDCEQWEYRGKKA